MQVQVQVQEAVLTAKDYYNLPHEFRERHELVNGYLVRRRLPMTPLIRRHGISHSPRARTLRRGDWERSCHRRRAICMVTSNPDSIRNPDALFVSNARLPRDGPLPDYFDGRARSRGRGEVEEA